MKVSNKSMASLAQATKNKNAKSSDMKSAKHASSTNSMDPAQIQLSKRAKQIQKAKSIASESTVDEAKVARFQNLIDSGRYTIDSAKIADSLVDEHMKLPT